MEADHDQGANIIARLAIGLCAVAVCLAYTLNWRDEAGGIVFAVGFLGLTIAAFSR